MSPYTPTAMKRWSCKDRHLPPVSEIKALHIYDFDNTLFMSPLPNLKLWTGPTVGFLQTQDAFVNGGWWHDEHILEATGEGIENEEPRAWKGWWNEDIVKLVELSLRQKDAMTILLTGRAERNFAHVVTRMAAAKNLDFDMVCLKPRVGPNNQRFSTTMMYKQSLLEELIYTYKDAEEIKIYEDRPKHVRGFREFFEKVNRAFYNHTLPVSRKSIAAEVIHVPDIATTLDPVVETAEVQRMINSHNTVNPAVRLQIKRTVFFTGYMLNPPDSSNLLNLVSLPTTNLDSEMKILANNIMITPRPAAPSVLEKVGGLGAKQIWQVTGTGSYQNSVWAARVAPIPSSANYYTENPTPIIVLAHRKNGKPIDGVRIQNWQPVPTEKQLVFETTVGEKIQLRIEREHAGENEYDSLFANGSKSQNNNNINTNNHTINPNKRRYPGDDNDDRRNDENRRPNGNYRGGNQHRGRGDRGGGRGGAHRNPPYPDRSRRDRDRDRDRDRRGVGTQGGGGGAGNGGSERRNRQRGYRSLDDVGGSARNGGYGSNHPNYDDGPAHGADYNSSFPPLGGSGRNGGGHNNGGGGGMYDEMDGLKY